ncbi:MAG TPA: hypothetical protein VFB58_14120 [Chloroflexota bacterium]|nr:hypothetical protein [Chloroflexota bacterium]
MHNTNTVRTIVYQDTTVQTAGPITVHQIASGQEDEVRNRERDREVFTVRTRLSSGKVRTIHYTIDIIFMNGRTYYRSTLLKKDQWQTHSGMSFCDRLSETCWYRGRTTVPAFSGITFTEQTSSDGSVIFHGGFKQPIYRPHTKVKQGTTAGTASILISPGPTRYVTRIQEQAVVTIKGRPITHETFDQRYGPFNQPLTIVPPAGVLHGTPS